MTGTSGRHWAGIVLLALLSYFQFPGHTFLQSDTQIYAPMFERLRDPELLAQDPMVVRAHTAYTLYDESVYWLDRLTGAGPEAVLGLLHVAARVALLGGIYMLALALGLPGAYALACAGVYGLGGAVNGPSVLLVEYEPVPRAFALAGVLLALGLAAHGRYLAAGVAGAVGFLMHPTTAAPFWLVLAVALAGSGQGARRALLRSLAPLLVAGAALAWAAAVQPGVSEPQLFWERLDSLRQQLIRLRAPYVLVSTWPAAVLGRYALMLALGAVAYGRLRRIMTSQLRMLAPGLALLGVASLPLSYLLLEKLQWGLLPQAQPLRTILFLQLFALLLSLALAFHLVWRERRPGAAAWWAAAAFSIGIRPAWLWLLAPPAAGWLAGGRYRWFALAGSVVAALAQTPGVSFRPVRDLFLALALGAMLVTAAELWRRRPRAGTAALAAAVVAAFFVIPGQVRWHWSGRAEYPGLAGVSRWARTETEREAVFLFADAGRQMDPGVFRADSRRAVYVDWKSGGQINFFAGFSGIWWRRWQETLADPFRPERLARFRELGIDYVVLRPQSRLTGREPVFANSEYLVYRLDPPSVSSVNQ
jgi:hypothetical protein